MSFFSLFPQEFAAEHVAGLEDWSEIYFLLGGRPRRNRMDFIWTDVWMAFAMNTAFQ